MYRSDTITTFNEVSGDGITTIVSGNDPKIILGVAMQQGNVSSDTEVRCGNDVVAKNYATNFSHVPINYLCDDDINITKTGNDDASVIITYAPYGIENIATTTYNPTSGIASSTDIQIYGSFTAGEVLIALLLFLIIVIELAKSIARGIGNIKTGKRYLQYHGGDVEIRHDL